MAGPMDPMEHISTMSERNAERRRHAARVSPSLAIGSLAISLWLIAIWCLIERYCA
jgi:hypothetical protein